MERESTSSVRGMSIQALAQSLPFSRETLLPLYVCVDCGEVIRDVRKWGMGYVVRTGEYGN